MGRHHNVEGEGHGGQLVSISMGCESVGLGLIEKCRETCIHGSDI